MYNTGLVQPRRNGQQWFPVSMYEMSAASPALNKVS